MHSIRRLGSARAFVFALLGGLAFAQRASPETPLNELLSRRAPAAPQSTKDSAPRAPLDARTTQNRVDFDRDADSVLWAKGENYKLSFDAGAARYYPFLASRAPKNFSIDIALRSVTLAGAELANDLRAAPQLDQRVVSFERGAVTERFSLAPREVEHEFVFASLPRRGELAVTLSLGSDMGASSSDDGCDFSNEFGRVRYGRATAVDAGGRELALVSTLDGDRWTITVPAAFVARATLPLVIDPVIATFGIEASPAQSFSPDVTFDATGTSVLYCWESEFSANDHDVWADMYDPSGNPLYHGGWIDLTANYWARPRSANLGASNRFLIVAHVQNAATGYIEVWGRTRSVTSATLSAQVKIAGTAAYDVLDPDVGGDPFATPPSYFLVVYERIYSFGVDHDLHGKLIRDDGTLVNGTVNIDTSVFTYDSVPSVSKSDDTNTWNIAWQRASPSGGNDIFGARVDWDGAVSTPTFPIAVNGFDDTNPSVSSSLAGTDRYLVAFEEDFGSDHDILACGIDVATVVKNTNLSAFDGTFQFQDQLEPSIDCDGNHFLVAYSENYSTSAVDYDVYASELYWNGPTLSAVAPHQTVTAWYGAEIEPQVAAATSSNPTNSPRDYAIAWHRAPDGQNFTSDDILGAEYTASSGGQVASFCDGASIVCPCSNGSSTVGGCPNSSYPTGAVLAWSGTPSTTSDTLQLFCGGLPSNVPCLFFQGAGSINGVTGAPFGDGVRCAASPMVRLGNKLASTSGGALYPAAGDAAISLKGLIPPAGTTVVYQVWYRNPAAFCTPSTTNLSNALAVAWTP